MKSSVISGGQPRVTSILTLENGREETRYEALAM